MSTIDASNLYDAVIIGGGPAGLTAAIYLARARYRVVVVERERFGGQITITDEVVNYPGVLRASGVEITETMRRQAEAFGAEFMLAEVKSLDLSGDIKRLATNKGELACYGVLLATGAKPRSLGFPGEERFRGHGVAYCATCDGEFFTGKDVFVVGGGFAAAEESVFLTKYARSVTVLVRGADFTCAPAAAEGAKNHPKIRVLYNTEVLEATGAESLSGLRYRNTLTGEVGEYRAAPGETFGLFVFVGYAPATDLVRGLCDVDDAGYVLTDASHMTSAKGLFAAGDVCVKELRQVATAVGEAAATATAMERYLKASQERCGVVPKPPISRLNAAREDTHPSKGADAAANGGNGDSALFTPDMLAQLAAVFSRMQGNLTLKLYVDDRPVSRELIAYMEALAAQTDALTAVRASAEELAKVAQAELPFVRVERAGGIATGLAFHGVPGGHEFTSFVLGLYNAAGPGQPISEEDRAQTEGLDEDIAIKVLVSLSCTMCPETVVSAQRIASLNSHVTAEAYDIAHFADLRDRYRAMSVPCTVVVHADGREHVTFGKKDIAGMLDALKA